MVLSQWECLLKNLGSWSGSFTRCSTDGEILEDTPTLVTLEGIDDNKTVHQLVRRFYPNRDPEDLVLEYTSLNTAIRFFENGAFCQGSLQWGPFSEFGGEFGLIEGDRRLRIVILYNREGKFHRLTLIREKATGSNTDERPPLTVEQLVGQWKGKATTIYSDWREPEIYSTHLQVEKISDRHLKQKLTFGEHTLESTAIINNSTLLFNQSNPAVKIVMLPDGASSNCPVEIIPGQPFFLEIGWLVAPNRRQRLIRSYGAKGEWSSLTLVEEEKIAKH